MPIKLDQTSGLYHDPDTGQYFEPREPGPSVFRAPRHDWTFGGFSPYIDAAAAELASDPKYVGRAGISWHGKQVQVLLGQFPDLVARVAAGVVPDGEPAELVAELGRIYQSSLVLSRAIQAAILDVLTNTGQPIPDWLTDRPDAKGRKAK